MQYDVTLLRAQGMRLRTRELQAPVRGELVVAMDDGRTSFKRPLLVAKLKVPRGASGLLVDALLPLFDVELVALADAITLQGIELDHRESRVYELRQMWRCVPVMPLTTG